MKRLIVICLVIWLSVDLVVLGDDGPPVVPPPVVLTPTPTLPFDGDGAKRVPDAGKGFPEQPQKEDSPVVTRHMEQGKPTHYVIVGMYEHMLQQVQHKRRWPVGDPVGGCALMHDGGMVCQ